MGSRRARGASLRRTTTKKERVINSKIFVGNLSYDTMQEDLTSLFSEVGEIVEVFLPADRNTGRPRGFAFVKFEAQEAAAEAIEKFDGHELKGRSLRVNEAEERAPRAPRAFSPEGGGGPPGGYKGQKRPNPKGSRRNLRGRKRRL